MSLFQKMAEPPQLPSVPPLPSVPRDVVSRRLHKDQAELVNLIVAQIGATAFRLANCQTVPEFLERRKEVFRRYSQLSIALANVVAAEAGGLAALAELTDEAFTEFECTFRRKAEAPLLPGDLDEALFCLSTLHRTYKLWNRIVVTPVLEQSKMEDRQTAAEFTYWILWSQLHLDCLLMALGAGIKLSAEVIPEILSGLRGAVMAYSCARQGVRLREFTRHFDFPGVPWDQEDQRLADQSTNDRETTLGGW